MRVAVDADILVYRCCWSSEPTFYDAHYDGKFLETFRYKKDYTAYVKKQPEDKQEGFEAVKRVEILPFKQAAKSVDITINLIRN